LKQGYYNPEVVKTKTK